MQPDPTSDPFDALVRIVARLRAEDGCPWDRAQTPQTVRAYILEEAYEVVEAIDLHDSRALREELGDLLFNVLLLAQIAAEEGDFTVHDVARDIHDKMLRRHPHVFGDAAHTDREAIARSWDRIKKAERGSKSDAPPSALDGVPTALPALLRAQSVGRKAARIGFDWPDAEGPRLKIDEELAELDQARELGDADAIAEELGDVLFSVVNLARHLRDADGRPILAEDALRQTVHKFEARFRRVEALAQQAGVDVNEADMKTLDAWWDRAKMEGVTARAGGRR